MKEFVYVPQPPILLILDPVALCFQLFILGPPSIALVLSPVLVSCGPICLEEDLLGACLLTYNFVIFSLKFDLSLIAS